VAAILYNCNINDNDGDKKETGKKVIIRNALRTNNGKGKR
jgi:hypothetical protein